MDLRPEALGELIDEPIDGLRDYLEFTARGIIRIPADASTHAQFARMDIAMELSLLRPLHASLVQMGRLEWSAHD